MDTSNFDEEYWRPMPGFDNYMISTFGHARKVKDDVLQTYDKSSGTKNIPVFTEDDHDVWKLYTRSHQLKTTRVDEKVAETFLNKPFGSVKINHIDGNIHNNAIWNLEWVFDEEEQGKKIAASAIKHVKQDLENGEIQKEVTKAVKDMAKTIKTNSQGDLKVSQPKDNTKANNTTSDADNLMNPEGLDDLINDFKEETPVEKKPEPKVETPKPETKKKSGKYKVVRQSDKKEYTSISNLSSTEGLPYEKVRDSLNNTGKFVSDDGETYLKEDLT